MKAINYLLGTLICTFSLSGCSEKKSSHIEFLSVPVDGTITEYLNKIQSESSSTSGCFSDNLGLKVDNVDFEKELFNCSNQESKESPTYFWIEYEVYGDANTNKVVYLEGKSIVGWESLDIVKIKLFESLGQATYTGYSLTDSVKNSWDDIERSLYQNMSKNFVAWDCGTGIVIIDYEGPKESKWADYGFFMMYIVDRNNYWESCKRK